MPVDNDVEQAVDEGAHAVLHRAALRPAPDHLVHVEIRGRTHGDQDVLFDEDRDAVQVEQPRPTVR